MANRKNGLGKVGLLSSTALTRHVAVVGSLGLVFGASSAFALDPNALPKDPNVVGGNASFNQSGSTLTVNQSSNRTVIDWRSFDIGSNATTTFVQPGASSIAVNRVNSSTNPTEIQGHLNANGQVWILNPNGVMFGKTAKVDVAGIVASTANIDAHAFMAGDNRLQLSGADHGEVSNEGSVTVADGGLAAFVAPSVRNSGVINARLGKVTLAAGTTYTLDLAGDRLVEIGLGANNAVVDQSGQVLADGSRVTLTAKAASAVVDSVVNVSGTVLASGVHEEGGSIVLTADNVTTTSSAVLAADGGDTGNGGTITAKAENAGNYAGSFSAKGGANGGNGGHIETSGSTIAFGDGFSAHASAAHGTAGKWLIDPSDITIDSVLAASLVSTLEGGSDIEVTTSEGTGGNGDLTLAASINAAATNGADLTLTGRHVAATGGSTVSISGAGSEYIVNVNAVNPNANVTGQATNWIQDAVNTIGTVAGGSTINVGAGTYKAGTTVAKSNVTLTGEEGAKIVVGVGQIGMTLNANNVTLQGFEIAGPVVGDQATLDWTVAVSSEGVRIENKSNSNVTITDNNIHDVRTGILVANSGGNGTQATTLTDAATGTISDNVIENTKGGILVQYRDGHTLDIHGNSEGVSGNEWGIVTGLQSTKVASDASLARQAEILALANGNNGMTVMDRQYATANRSEVTVDATGTATAADDFNLGNGVGNERQPINNVQQGINAVVAGGTVNVNDGTYTVSSGYLSVGKSLNLIGESEAGVIIDAHGASSYGLRVIGGTSDVNLSNFTLYGVVADGGYGVKVEDSQNVNIDHVTSQGADKAQFDFNGVRGGSLDYVTANGAAIAGGNGSSRGAAIAITDSQDLTVSNSSTSGGSYGGIAIYQSNKPSGYTYQTKNITLADSNTYAETNAVYTEDESATNNFGTLNVAGFDYVVGNNGSPADVYSWFQKTEQGAIDFATAISAGTAFVQGWTGSAGDNVFTVAYNTARTLGLSINEAVKAASAGATINVGAGVYNGGIAVNKQGVTLTGAEGAKVNVVPANGAQLNGFDVTANDVTIQGFEVAGEIVGSYLTYAFDNTVSRGIFVYNGVNNFNITDNNIHDVRTGVIIDGRNTGSLTNNVIDNTKGAVSIQYTDAGVGNTEGYAVTMTGNSEGTFGNEWGVNVHLNGHQDGGVGGSLVGNATKIAAEATSTVQQALLANSAANGGWSVQDQGYSYSNRTSVYVDTAGSAANQGSQRAALNSINDGIKAVVTGGTVHVNDGTYVIASGGGNYLHIDKALNLIGQSEAGTIIDASGASTYGIRVQADDVSLSDFTVKGPTSSGGYGIKVEPLAGAVVDPNNRLNDFSITNVTIKDSYKTGLDLNGVTGATIDHVTVTGATHGNGIALTDTADATLTNVSTSGNTWGGLALYQTNRTYNQQTSDITVDATNSFGEANGVYLEDESASLDYGSLNIAGYSYAAHNTNASDAYTWLQTTVAGAANMLQAGGVLASGYVNGWTGSASDSALYVGHTTGGDAMSIAAAVSAAAEGATVNLLSGAFALGTGQLNINKGLTLVGEGEGVTTISTTSAGYGVEVTGDDVTLSGFTFNANPSGTYAIKVQPDTGVTTDRVTNFAIDHVTINGSKKTALDLNAVDGATIDNVTVTNTTAGNGIALTDSANVTITNVTTSGNAWGGLALYQANRFYDLQTSDISVDDTNSFGETNGVYLEDSSASKDFGDVTVEGYAYAAHNADAADFYTWLQTSVEGAANQLQVRSELANGYVNGWTGSGSDSALYVGHTTGGDAMSINAAVANSAAGNTINVGSGTYGEDVVVTGARNVVFNGSTLDSYTQNVASAIGGSVTAAGGFVLNGLTTLLSNTVLNGAVTADAIDGGAHSLAVNGGATVLNGDSYKAASLNFNGTSTTLTAANTAFNTAASNGDITFTGPLFGTTDGAQGVSFNAGTAGDISLQNAGTDTVWLGDMTVSGHDFSAATVYVNSFTSVLTGNQTFTDETLNTKGGVQSTVAGNATGPINAGGNVGVNAGGDFSGNVTGNAMNVSGHIVTGTFTGNSLTLTSTGGVNVTANVGTLVLDTPTGTVNGTYKTLVNNGGTVVVNGQTHTGDVGTNPNQIVVEGFTLPAGAFVNSSGEIVLPNGLLIGLVSPAAGPGAEGGKPKVVIVHSVRKLGELLAQGYAAIIVDLNSNSDEEEVVAMN